ncbi:MAG: cytochrome c maturation protein CcmE, partial [Fidelibacterota bacterium]
ISFIIIVIAISYFVFSGFQKGAILYVTIEELKSQGEKMVGERVRLGGSVLAGSITRNEKEMIVKFAIFQEQFTVPVVYQGVTPDLFKDGAEVIVEGEYTGDGWFRADKLMAKCPSKYEKKDYKVYPGEGEESS